MCEAARLLDHYLKAVGFEVLELLDLRSKLASQESDLDPPGKTRLAQADSLFLGHAPLFFESVASIGDLTTLRRQAGVPCSHWWWYLEKLAHRAPAKV